MRAPFALVDAARLQTLRMDCGDDVAADLIALFGRSTPALLDRLDGDRSRGDTASLRATAHQLKGSCLSIGASFMASLALDLEHGADPAAAIEALVAALGPTGDALTQGLKR